MKRLFLTLLCLLTFCGIADARMLQGIAGAVTAASCGITEVQETQNEYALLGEDVSVDTIYIYGVFTTTSEQVLKTAYVYLKKNNSPTFNIRMFIYDTANSKPTGSPLCTSDADYLSSSLTTSFQWIKFQFSSGCSLNNAKKYAIVLFDVEGTVSASSVVMWGLNSDATGASYGYSADGSTWTATSNDDQMDFRLTTCAE